jgi:hypothetical protein
MRIQLTPPWITLLLTILLLLLLLLQLRGWQSLRLVNGWCSTWANNSPACTDCNRRVAAAAVVVVLSPDFVTKPYPMEELLQVMESRRAGATKVRHVSRSVVV